MFNALFLSLEVEDIHTEIVRILRLGRRINAIHPQLVRPTTATTTASPPSIGEDASTVRVRHLAEDRVQRLIFLVMKRIRYTMRRISTVDWGNVELAAYVQSLFRTLVSLERRIDRLQYVLLKDAVSCSSEALPLHHYASA